MVSNGMQFVFSVMFVGWCIDIGVLELCPFKNYTTPDVQFCYQSSVENKNVIYIGNDMTPIQQNTNCSCTISPLNLQTNLSVNWKQPSDAVNISFVLQDGTSIVMRTGTSRTVKVTGVVHVFYQSVVIEPQNRMRLCFELIASPEETFSVQCEREIKFNDTTIARPSSPTTTNNTTQGSTINLTITNTTGTAQGVVKTTHTKNGQNAVLLGSVIGGTCGVIVIIVAVIVTCLVVRRRKRESPTPAPKDEDIVTENPIYDRDDTQNDGTIMQNEDTDNDAAHYSTISSSEETVDENVGPNTRSETKQQEYYSKIDKTKKHCKGNNSRNKPHDQDCTDNYDRTDVKREIQPFNEYNHLSTLHGHSQDALGDYDRTNFNFGGSNEGHAGDSNTYNTAISH